MWMLRKFFERSLLLRIGAAMAAITLFAVTAMVSSVIIADTVQGRGAAIDHAGSLRMQSFRIASLVFIAKQERTPKAWKSVAVAMARFERRLNDPHLTNQFPRNPHSAVNLAYQNVNRGWYLKLKPELERIIRTGIYGKNMNYELFVKNTGTFVSTIDIMVKRLADNTEQKITLLRAILGIALFLTLIVVFITMYLMRTAVLIPLRELLVCASSIGHNNFNARTRYTGEDELGRLGQAFNRMTEDLSRLYQDMEVRVQEKTADLARSNRSLELLYHSISRLHNSPMAAGTYAALLRDIENTIGTGRGTVCLVDSDGQQAHILASTLHDLDGNIAPCTLSNCTRCLKSANTRIRQLGGQGEHPILALPLRDMERQYGILQLELTNGKNLEDWQIQLLEALCRHIGIAIGTARRSEESRQLSLLEERALIARELHDSLAQSLSYMKIQVSRLQALLGNNSAPEPLQVLGELREGLNLAYRQLRELLTTFRLKISGGGLVAALDTTVREFRDRGEVDINLQVHLTGCSLSAHEEIHVLQIIREALANVLHHAQATHADINIECGADERIIVTLDDDGIGITNKSNAAHHYGISIMEERARSLGGKLSIVGLQRGGTRVELRFRSGSKKLSTANQPINSSP